MNCSTSEANSRVGSPVSVLLTLLMYKPICYLNSMIALCALLIITLLHFFDTSGFFFFGLALICLYLCVDEIVLN